MYLSLCIFNSLRAVIVQLRFRMDVCLQLIVLLYAFSLYTIPSNYVCRNLVNLVLPTVLRIRFKVRIWIRIRIRERTNLDSIRVKARGLTLVSRRSVGQCCRFASKWKDGSGWIRIEGSSRVRTPICINLIRIRDRACRCTYRLQGILTHLSRILRNVLSDGNINLT